MDHFVDSSFCGDPRNLAYADPTTVQPYWNLAAGGALADRWFQPTLGQSSSNDMFLFGASFIFLDNAVEPAAPGAECSITTTHPFSFDTTKRSAISWSRTTCRGPGTPRGWPRCSTPSCCRAVPTRRSIAEIGRSALSLRPRSRRHPGDVLPAVREQSDVRARLRLVQSRSRRARLAAGLVHQGARLSHRASGPRDNDPRRRDFRDRRSSTRSASRTTRPTPSSSSSTTKAAATSITWRRRPPVDEHPYGTRVPAFTRRSRARQEHSSRTSRSSIRRS